MNMDRIKTDADMVEYLTECTLATVEHQSRLKSKSKSEFDRQMSIAQAGIDWLRVLPKRHSGRVAAVIYNYRSVAQWLEHK